MCKHANIRRVETADEGMKNGKYFYTVKDFFVCNDCGKQLSDRWRFLRRWYYKFNNLIN